MTFKHVKFDDSPIMRSLERVAKEKGLVTADSMQKTASAKNVDLTPSSNLMDNIFKLCSGLREQGLEKYADELEVNFLNYKRAQTLYETSKEKGEDLINAAHPKGSHHLEDVGGDEAVVENILDKHLKMLDVVHKKPTGKLSTASAINAIKIVLGQEVKDVAEQMNSIAKNLLRLLETINYKVENQGNLNITGNLPGYRGGYRMAKSGLTARPITIDNINYVKKGLTFMKNHASPGYLGGIPDDLWLTVGPELEQFNGPLAEMSELRMKQQSGSVAQYKAPEQAASVQSAYLQRIDSLIGKVNMTRSTLSRYPQDKQKVAAQYLDNNEKTVTALKTFLTSLKTEAAVVAEKETIDKSLLESETGYSNLMAWLSK